jgi:hypothetical protein
VKIDFAVINSAALSHFRRLVTDWLPGGKFEGREYVALNPTRPDHSRGSFKVNVETGKWKDFALSQRGGRDPIGLYAYIKNLSRTEAARRLALEFGMNSHQTSTDRGQHRHREIRRTPYHIRDINCALIASHVRVDYYDDEKSDHCHKTCFWQRNGKWGLDGLPVTAVPLFGTELLKTLPDGAEVVCVEGEKPATVLRKRGFVAVATACGSGSIPDDSQLAVLKRFRVSLWPDNDSDGKGQEHMRRIAAVDGDGRCAATSELGRCSRNGRRGGLCRHR